jgi:hypothetical protein
MVLGKTLCKAVPHSSVRGHAATHHERVVVDEKEKKEKLHNIYINMDNSLTSLIA